MLEKVIQVVVFSEDQPACNGKNNRKIIKALFDLVVTFYFGNKNRIFVNSIFTTRTHTTTWVLTSLPAVATTTQAEFTYHLNENQITILRLSTIVFYFHWFMNHITTLFCTPSKMIPAIQKLAAKMSQLVHINLQFGHIIMILNTWVIV